jgi:hypothetical protein
MISVAYNNSRNIVTFLNCIIIIDFKIIASPILPLIAKAKLLPHELSYLAPVILELLKRRPLYYYTHVPYKEVGYYATGWPLEMLGIDEEDLEQLVEYITTLNPPFYVLAAIAPVGKDKVRPCGLLVQIRMDKILDFYSNL